MTGRMRGIAAMLSCVLLAGCGGGGGGGDGSTSGDSSSGGAATNGKPIATVGALPDVAINSAVSLDGSASSDPDGERLTYEWAQTGGPDVTNGAGSLSGVAPSFTAPPDVSTLFFALIVNDGNVDSNPDTVQVNVVEHTGSSFYVDGDTGSDTTGDGSREKPFSTISKALDSIPGPNHDIYVRTLDAGAYDETGATLDLPDDTSLYGGYDGNWVRDVTDNRTVLSAHVQGVHFTAVDHDAWLSGFELSAADSGAATPLRSSAVSVDSGTATLYIQDNSITSGNVTAATVSPTDSYGLRLAGVSAVRVLRNTITAGSGGDSSDEGSDGVRGVNGRGGQSTPDHLAGNGGCEDFDGNGCPGILNSGGLAGQGGDRGGKNGAPGHDGWRAGDPPSRSGGSGGAGGFGGSSTNSGQPGGGGEGGAGGRGGAGGTGDGTVIGGYYRNDTAQDGADGEHGEGGGGGGGGEGGAAFVGDPGGGGGGGGQGGIAGTGGGAGGSGGASIGILLDGITFALIDGNTIASGNGGAGAAGGIGGSGGSGGNGGKGRGKVDDGERGGGGGGGGGAGAGGQGGAGAGGPSYSILVGADIAPVISNNDMIAGSGGAPGPDGAGTGGGAYGGRGGDDGNPGTREFGGSGGALPQANAAAGAPAEGGWSYNIFDVDPFDGLVPAANGNDMTPGAAGRRGGSGVTNF